MPSSSSTAAPTPSSLQEASTQDKVGEYTNFLNTVLRPELLEAKRLLEETNQEIAEYEQLRSTIEKGFMQQQQQATTTVVDLGYQTIHCHAELLSSEEDDPPDTAKAQKIFVHVGLGFHVEMTISEALKFIQQRILFLQSNLLKDRQQKVHQIQDHVQSSMNILEELEKVQKGM